MQPLISKQTVWLQSRKPLSSLFLPCVVVMTVRQLTERTGGLRTGSWTPVDIDCPVTRRAVWKKRLVLVFPHHASVHRSDGSLWRLWTAIWTKTWPLRLWDVTDNMFLSAVTEERQCTCFIRQDTLWFGVWYVIIPDLHIWILIFHNYSYYLFMFWLLV